jgi:hypothetical protein
MTNNNQETVKNPRSFPMSADDVRVNARLDEWLTFEQERDYQEYLKIAMTVR